MKIKTVYEEVKLEIASVFDEKVNALLEDGWQLVKRDVVPGYDLDCVYYPPAFYAELVKLEEADMVDLEADPITWQDAVWVLRETCQEAKECGPACPMYDWCQKSIPGNNCPPCGWGDPEELEQPE